jgi:predicted TIM-barrel fold metal-dependent hydrolase
VTRRSLLAAPLLAAAPPAIPVIDTHIHLFDPTRPRGIPWPEKTNPELYRPALPARYRALAEPFGVVGAIEVECSPWFEDNQWVLDIAENDPIMLGMIGNLEPAAPEFPRHLERFRKNPLFLGIRYGNLWDRNFAAALGKPAFVEGLRLLAQAGLTLDTANPSPALLADIVRLTDKLPSLRVVVDHLPSLALDAKSRESLRELVARPNVFVKVSAVPLDPAVARPRLDEIFGLFGPSRLLYGSDWPNSDRRGPYPKVFEAVHGYFLAKGTAVAEQYFWRNSLRAYRWRKRAANQPSA